MLPRSTRLFSTSSKLDVRRRVMWAIDDGMSRKEAVRVFGVSYSTIGKWLRRRRSRSATPEMGQRGRPRGATLLEWNEARVLVSTIHTFMPDKFGLPFALWTRQAVVKYADKRIGAALSLSTAGLYLRAWGLTPEKPRPLAWEEMGSAAREWLQTEYPRIRRRAKREGAEIHWGDVMRLRDEPQPARGHRPRGATPVRLGSGKRSPRNVISAITNRGMLRFMVFKRRLTSAVFAEFLSRLERDVPGKITLIVEDHPVHKSRTVARWLTRSEQRGRIRMIVLPAHSAQLNRRPATDAK